MVKNDLQTLTPCYTSQELAQLDPKHIPEHVAMVPDGNGRWAKRNMLSVEKGHMTGYERVVNIVRAAKELGIKMMTLYAFSTENWKRPKDEVHHLMRLTEEYLVAYQQKLIEENISLKAIGNINLLPAKVKAILHETIESTASCTEFTLVLAINYGGRDELVRAIANIVAEKIDPKDITEKTVADHLDTRFLPDPDLLIRTSGENRLSNFLLWQSSYAEVYIEDVAWPDYSAKHLLQAVCDYQKRERRHGGRT